MVTTQEEGISVRSVLLIEDHRFQAEALIAFLKRRNDLLLFHCHSSTIGSQATFPTIPDVVLIDKNVQARNLCALTRKVKDEQPQTEVIVLGVEDDEECLALIEAGATGYLMAGESPDSLLRMIDLVRSGRTRCSRRIASLLVARLSELSRECCRWNGPRLSELTLREKQILQQFAQGSTNKEISNRLEISLNTVKNHVHTLLKKLGVGNRREAMQIALAVGLIAALRRRQVAEHRAAYARMIGPTATELDPTWF